MTSIEKDLTWARQLLKNLLPFLFIFLMLYKHDWLETDPDWISRT